MPSPRRKLQCVLLTCAWGPLALGAEPLWLGRFEATGDAVPPPWEVVRPDHNVPATQYRVRQWQGVAAIEATADRSMALLAREVTADLTVTPVLCWRWRVDAPLVAADMKKKSGDDYAARVYVAFALPAAALSRWTRAKLRLARTIYGERVPDAALNYVWDNRYPVGSAAPNAYTDRTHMFVVQSGAQHAGAWVSERRDLLADLSSAFATSDARITSIAVAVDTDNTAERAHAGFAALHLVARDAPCATP